MITTRELLDNRKALKKAEDLNPAVLKMENSFWINGANDVYVVLIKGDISNAVIDCDCKAGNFRNACYHAAAAFLHVLKEDIARRAAEAKADFAAEFDFDFETDCRPMSSPAPQQRPRLINFIDSSLLNRSHSDYANFLDICCTIEVSEKAAAWFSLSEANRPKSFADFAGI